MVNNKKRILCVDDDKVILTKLKIILEKEYVVETVRSGKEALDHLEKSDILPDLILLDIIMPEMDGWETLNNIRGITLSKDIPIIFITSLGASIKEQAIARGGADFLTKPIDDKELLIKIKMVLKNKKTA